MESGILTVAYAGPNIWLLLLDGQEVERYRTVQEAIARMNLFAYSWGIIWEQLGA